MVFKSEYLCVYDDLDSLGFIHVGEFYIIILNVGVFHSCDSEEKDCYDLP